MRTSLGIPIVVSEAIEPGTMLIVPQVYQLPQETRETYLKRLASLSVKLTGLAKETDD